jgi:hypothetical protein
MCGSPSKLKASLTLIQLVNMKQLFLQQDNVMFILNYMVFIIFIYFNYLSMVVQEVLLAKRLEGINLTSNHKHLFHFFSWKKSIHCLQKIHDTKVNLLKIYQRFYHSLLISLWQIELLQLIMFDLSFKYFCKYLPLFIKYWHIGFNWWNL